MKEYQLIVIGAGPGGYEAAIKAAQLGLTTAIIENRDVGGTCLNRGCIPTKALLHSAQLFNDAKEFDMFGLHAENVTFDMEKLQNRKSEVVSKLRSGIEQLVSANKIDIYRGTGSITDPHIVKITGEHEEEIEGEKIIIATGSVPARPPIPGLALPNVVTSDELLDSEEFNKGKYYKNLVIIGGGVIGVEFASVYGAFGCDITIVEAMDRILPTMDKEISQNLTMILKKRGVKIHTSAMVSKIEQNGDGLVCCFTEKEKEEKIECDGILVSIGRRANTNGLFSTDFTVEMDRGRIITDSTLKTNVDSIYAIGDVTAKIQLAHMASAQGIATAERIAGHTPTINLDLVPGCIYTNPEIASVGITEEQAKIDGIAIKKGKFIMTGNGKSLIENQERGFIKVLFNAQTNVIIGAQLMCARATDLISELATAIANELTQEQLASVIRPHPTFTEAVTEAIEDAEGCAIHLAPKKKK